MTTLASVLAAVERWYPLETAERWDAVGLTCGDPGVEVGRIVLAIDCVPETVAEAARWGAQLLLTHHPLLLSGVHGVPVTDPKGALVHQLISAGIAHYTAHTNADIAAGGVSQALADLFALRDLAPIERYPPAAAIGSGGIGSGGIGSGGIGSGGVGSGGTGSGGTGSGGTGSGRIGVLAQPRTLREFLELAAEVLPKTMSGLRAAGDPAQTIQTVAVCGGSGGTYAASARSLGADVLLTSDLKHHSTLEAVTERTSTGADHQPPMALVDAAHWATEAPWLPVVAAMLEAEFGSSVEVRVSQLVTDPWTLHAC